MTWKQILSWQEPSESAQYWLGYDDDVGYSSYPYTRFTDLSKALRWANGMLLEYERQERDYLINPTHIAIIKQLIADFLNEVGYISTPIIDAMVMQEL